MTPTLTRIYSTAVTTVYRKSNDLAVLRNLHISVFTETHAPCLKSPIS